MVRAILYPIVLPDGRKLLTLRDAAAYVTELRKAEHDAPEWQIAMEMLLLVAEREGPEMLARIAVMKALNRHSVEPVPAPRRTGQGFSDRSVMHQTAAALEAGFQSDAAGNAVTLSETPKNSTTKSRA